MIHRTSRRGFATIALIAAAVTLGAAAVAEIKVGDSYDQVIAELGKPSDVVTIGRTQSLSYKGGVINVEDGAVVFITPKFRAKVRQEAERHRAAEAQRAKGLGPHEGAWVAKKEKATLERAAERPTEAQTVVKVTPLSLDIPEVQGEIEDIIVYKEQGKEISLEALCVPGKITIVDFYADWCGPCRRISPHLEKLAKEDPDVVLRKVDIVKWNTPVAVQYGLRSIPNMRVYDRKTTQVGKSTSSFQQVLRDIAAAKKATVVIE